MASVCFYFQVHQPYRVKRYSIFNIGRDHNYFNHEGEGNLNNRAILQKVARKSYLPANAVLLELLSRHPQFRVSFSISGMALEQFENHAPEALDSFRKLVDTGRAEILSETYYHSLSFIRSIKEWKRQVELHRKKIRALFGIRPKIFRNTELIYRNDIAYEAERMGYEGILAEGADHILGWRSPNFVYRPFGAKKRIKLLLKNYRLSDDISFRFSSRDWKEYPLTAPKFAHWISAVNGNGEVINLFMDYETFGEHQWEDTGIFDFLRALPSEILKHKDNDFVTPSEAVERYGARGELDVPNYVSWADIERDLSAWLSNPLQNDAMRMIYDLEDSVMESKDARLIEDWSRLTTSDHFYYMCTKWFADGDVHKYFNPYDTPYDAYISYTNVLKDIESRLANCGRGRREGFGFLSGLKKLLSGNASAKS